MCVLNEKRCKIKLILIKLFILMLIKLLLLPQQCPKVLPQQSPTDGYIA